MNAEKGECIQDRICSFNSISPNQGTYCMSVVSTTSPFKNYLIDSSISSNFDEKSTGNTNRYLYNGEIRIKAINISYSKLKYRNFYEVYFNSNSNSTFSSFYNS